MALYAALRNNPRMSMHEIEECFDGNLCRCTGYRPILDAAKTFAVDHPSHVLQQQADASGNGGCCGGGGDCSSGSSAAASSGSDGGCGMAECCQRGIAAPTDPAVVAADAAAAAAAASNADVSVRKLVRSCSCTKGRGYGPLPAAAFGAAAANGQSESEKDSESEKESAADTETELIFPPALALHRARALTLSGTRGVTWLRPVSLLQLLRIKQRWGQAAKIVQVWCVWRAIGLRTPCEQTWLNSCEGDINREAEKSFMMHFPPSFPFLPLFVFSLTLLFSISLVSLVFLFSLSISPLSLSRALSPPQGNTEVGIETRFKGAHYGTQVAVSHVAELNAWTVGVEGASGRAGVFIGAAMSLSEMDARRETVLASHGMRRRVAGWMEFVG